MTRSQVHEISDDALALLEPFVGSSHDFLSFEATSYVSAFNGAYIGTHRLVMPKVHYDGAKDFAGDFIAIETDWLQDGAADYHLFTITADAVVKDLMRENIRIRPLRFDFTNPADRLARVEIYSAEFVLEYLDETPLTHFIYDKFIRFVAQSGTSLTLTTAHDSILGEIEIRSDNSFVATGGGPESLPHLRKTIH